MSKYKSFEELKKARQTAYAGMLEGDVLGFLDQHTGFYPDPAHFIYELLQNAEDMEAKEVTFKLFSDKLIFEHNGTKRDFNLDDIDAITNKGKSPKAEDPTQIGKFGMGFKAVYIYTNTPEIHSGKFNFKIKNIIIPEDKDVPKISKEHFTQFIFPFDNPAKPAIEAVKEIVEEGFNKLSETALLFLSHIKRIRYCLPDGNQGYISIQQHISSEKFLHAITIKQPLKNATISYWAKFSAQCPLIIKEKDSSNNAVKSFPVAIAYRLIKINDKFSLDSSLVGKVCLFFPTEMESLLRFHINAPFASTVARDVILSKGEDGEANDKLINKLADLAAESLHSFKDAGMLDYAAYSTLPTLRDYNNQPNSRYKIFATRIKDEFEKFDLFITDNGNYCSIANILNASKEIKTILPTKHLKKLYNKSWIPTVSSVTRIEYFIDQFDIKEYSIENFIDSLEKDYTFFNELFAEQKNSEYYKTLYLLFSQSKDREVNRLFSSFATRRLTRNEILRNVEFLMCEDGKLRSIKETLYLKTTYQPKYYIKNPIYLDINFKPTVQDKAIQQFLISLGVKEMCECEDFIADVVGDNVPADDMVYKIMEMVEKYKNGTINIAEYIDKPIFIATKGDQNFERVKAKECCWDTAAAFFFRSTHFKLSQKHYEILGDDLPVLKEVFIKLGGKVEPKIVKTSDLCADKFPLYHLLRKERERYDTCLKSTYTLDEFDWNELRRIKQENLTAEPILLWNVVLNCDCNDCLYTEYSPNGSSPLQRLESILVYHLKRIAWIPTVSGEYKYPYELNEEDLLDEYKYKQPSSLLIEISKKPYDTIEELKNKGIDDKNLITFAGFDSDIQEKALAYALQMLEKKSKTGRSLTEMMEDPDRVQLSEGDDDDGNDAPYKSENLDKRRKKIEKEFDNPGLPNTFMHKLKFVIEKSNQGEKTFIKEQYHARCQICGAEGILMATGNRYFEAINIFDTGKLDDRLQIKFDIGWNTLGLCPNCAAKFKYSQLKISNLIAQVQNIDCNTIHNGTIDIAIELENKTAKIHFTPKHLLALQVAIKKIKEIENNQKEQ